MGAIEFEVVATRTRGQPDFMQGLLQIDDDLAEVPKRQRNHAADALVINVRFGVVVDAIASGLHAGEQPFRVVHEFEVGHYNLPMLKRTRILASGLFLAAGAVVLAGCGQKGPLILPHAPASAASMPSTSVTPGAPLAPAASNTP